MKLSTTTTNPRAEGTYCSGACGIGIDVQPLGIGIDVQPLGIGIDVQPLGIGIDVQPLG